MARESEFIDKLSDFTKSLENLVELLKEQQKNGPTEVVNQLLENIDADAIATIASNVEEVKENTKQINKNIEKTLEAVKNIKQERETGMMGEVSSKKNSNKIVDGIKTVILIAGGVLAIGLAFKIVGKVDFFSVVSLGLSIMFIAKAFAIVASIKDDKGKPISYKRALIVSLMLITMSAAILSAGFILKQMPLIGIKEIISIVGVGLGMGIASYFLLQAIGKISRKSLLMAPLIPLLIPEIALGIVAAGLILKFMPNIPLRSVLNALLVSIALVPISIAMGFLIKGLKGAKIKDVLMVPIIVPLMALGIVLASWVLNGVVDIPLMATIKAGIGIGIATLFMVPTLWLLNKSGLLKPGAIKSLAIGVVVIALISTAIMISSWILSVGNYKKAPDWKWALGAGLSIIMFTPTLLVVGAIITLTGGLGIEFLAVGTLGIILIAAAIAVSSHILGAGDYSVYPPAEWAAGVGLSIFSFGISMVLFGILLPLILLGQSSILLIAGTIILVSELLGAGDYSVYPTVDWIGGVSLSIFSFGISMALFGILLPLIFIGSSSLLIIAKTIVDVSNILSGGDYKNFPSVDWSRSMAISLIAFGIPAVLLGIFIAATLGFGMGIIQDGLNAVLMIAATIAATSFILGTGNYKGGPTKDWAEGIALAIGAFGDVFFKISSSGLFGLFGGISPDDFIGFINGIADALIQVADKFNKGGGVFDESKVPSEDWAKGVGITITAFAKGIAAMDDAGVDIDADDLNDDDGMISVMVGIAKAIIAVGNYFNKHGITFDLNQVPSEDWSKGVGGSITAFAKGIAAMDDAGVDIDADDLYDDDGMIAVMIGLASGIIAVAWVFNNSKTDFNLNTIPDEDWAKGIGTSIKAFVNITKTTKDLDFVQLWNIVKVAKIMTHVAWIFNIMQLLDMPSEEWTNSFIKMLVKGTLNFAIVGSILASFKDFYSGQWRILSIGWTMYDFAETLFNINEDFGKAIDSGIADKISKSLVSITKAIPKKEQIDPIWELIHALYALSNISWVDLLDIKIVSNVIEDLTDKIDKINGDKIDSLARLGVGLEIMSLVDNEKLKKTLDLIEKKSSTLKEITDDNSPIRKQLNDVKNEFIDVNKKRTEQQNVVNKPGTKPVETFEDKLLKYVSNIDKNITKMSDIEETEREETLKAKDVEDD